MKIFLIGPGGVGKSTCGKILAHLLGYHFIDLDQEFCDRIENIGNYIDANGYEQYCLENSKLFYNIIGKQVENCIFSLSSGFLVHENMNYLTEKHKRSIKDLGISLLILPSESLDESTDIIVQRQLSRGFSLNEEKEKRKIMHRYPLYKKMGDIKIISADSPESIAEQMKKEIVTFQNTI